MMISEQKQDSQPSPKGEDNSEGKSDKIAGKIAGGILRAQGYISDRMNGFKYLKLLLICFCVTSAVISGYVFVDAIVSKSPATKRIKVDRISLPEYLKEENGPLFDEKIPEEIYQDIQRYKMYMDSTGAQIRPGLADSMRILEEMYLQQQK